MGSLFSIVCVFLTSGKTFTFRDGEILVDNQTIFVFTYNAMSDSLLNTATFYKDSVAGISVTPQKET